MFGGFFGDQISDPWWIQVYIANIRLQLHSELDCQPSSQYPSVGFRIKQTTGAVPNGAKPG